MESIWVIAYNNREFIIVVSFIGWMLYVILGTFSIKKFKELRLTGDKWRVSRTIGHLIYVENKDELYNELTALESWTAFVYIRRKLFPTWIVTWLALFFIRIGKYDMAQSLGIVRIRLERDRRLGVAKRYFIYKGKRLVPAGGVYEVTDEMPDPQPVKSTYLANYASNLLSIIYRTTQVAAASNPETSRMAAHSNYLSLERDDFDEEAPVPYAYSLAGIVNGGGIEDRVGETVEPEPVDVCPHCGGEINTDFSFCPYCGRVPDEPEGMPEEDDV